jgi:hypothetical protein
MRRVDHRRLRITRPPARDRLLVWFRLPLLLLLGVTVHGVVGYRVLEGWSLLDALSMTVITLATVGFHEVPPLGPRGQVFTISLILVGVVALFVALGAVTELVVSGQLARVLRRRRMDRRISRLDQHTAICAYGRVGRAVAEELTRRTSQCGRCAPEAPDDDQGEKWRSVGWSIMRPWSGSATLSPPPRVVPRSPPARRCGGVQAQPGRRITGTNVRASTSRTTAARRGPAAGSSRGRSCRPAPPWPPRGSGRPAAAADLQAGADRRDVAGQELPRPGTMVVLGPVPEAGYGSGVEHVQAHDIHAGAGEPARGLLDRPGRGRAHRPAGRTPHTPSHRPDLKRSERTKRRLSP